jgi:hypothetical protein
LRSSILSEGGGGRERRHSINNVAN